MRRKQVELGARVRSLVDFVGVPTGTEGVIDELYDGGFMVAWDGAPGCPRLPAGYRTFAERNKIAWRFGTLRDGFSYREAGTLELVRPPKPRRTERDYLDDAVAFP